MKKHKAGENLTKFEERVERIKQFKAGRKFLRRRCKKESTRSLYARGVLMFSDYMEKNLDEIVGEYKEDYKENAYECADKWEMIFRDYKDYLKEKYPKGQTAKTYFAAAKGLINANVPSSAKVKAEAPKAVSRSIKPISKEDLKNVRDMVGIRERAFIDVLKDSGVSRADAVRINYGDVKKAMEDTRVRFLKLDMFREKEGIEYVTWLGPNAIRSLRLYFEKRRQTGDTLTDSSPVFARKKQGFTRLKGTSVGLIFWHISNRTGIKISPHRLRKFFETYMAAAGVHPVTCKYWMGHKVGSMDIESSYIIPPINLQRKQYKKAYSYIDLEGREKSERERRIQAIIDNAVAIGLSDETLQSIKQEAENRDMTPRQMAIRVHQAAREAGFTWVAKRTVEGETGSPGEEGYEDQFIEIPEEELLQRLNGGWEIVHKRQNGTVIVKRR